MAVASQSLTVYSNSSVVFPAWEAITRLGKACNAALKYTNPKELFQEMVGATAAFKDAEWGKDALPVQLRFAGSRG